MSPAWIRPRTVKVTAIECDGSRCCQAVRHVHGCYSDNGRNCDHPSEHLRVGMVVGDDGQLRRFGT